MDSENVARVLAFIEGSGAFQTAVERERCPFFDGTDRAFWWRFGWDYELDRQQRTMEAAPAYAE